MMFYKNYSQTDVKWLGEIPEHWNLLPLRAIFEERKESNKNLDVDLILSLVKDVGIMPYSEKGDVGNKSKDDLSQYKIAREKDLVLNKMNAVIGSLGVSKYIGLVSPIYLVLFIRNHTEYFIDYFSYVFQSKTLQESLSQYASGIMKIRESIEFLEFKKMRLPIPPLEEQKVISTFLDMKSTQIEKFIQDKTRFIQLLKEQKEVVISEAITKGLDNKVEFRDSQIDWLGNIPKHWEIKKLKYLFKIQKRIANSLGYDVLSITQQGIKLKDIESGEGQLSMDYSKYQLLYKDEFAMNHMDLLTGFVDLSKFDGVVSPDYRVFTINDETFCKKYFLYIFQMGYRNKIFFGLGQGVSQLGRWRFPAENFENFKIQIPPVEEQEQIAEYIENELSQIDKLIEKTTKEIELIKEYKTSLINEAVSGKIKVV